MISNNHKTRITHSNFCRGLSQDFLYLNGFGKLVMETILLSIDSFKGSSLN